MNEMKKKQNTRGNGVSALDKYLTDHLFTTAPTLVLEVHLR